MLAIEFPILRFASLSDARFANLAKMALERLRKAVAIRADYGQGRLRI
jgi:hypothetical protein